MCASSFAKLKDKKHTHKRINADILFLIFYMKSVTSFLYTLTLLTLLHIEHLYINTHKSLREKDAKY